MKRNIFRAALAAACLISFVSFPLALLLLAFVSVLLAPSTQFLRVTLSVPELLMDVLDAFKADLPFMNNMWTDFSTKTAVKGDTITAHVAALPVTQSYDVTQGFQANAATADSLLTDVPVTLNQFFHVPVKITWLTQLASKIPLYKEAIRNTSYVMAKKVVDYALSLLNTSNFSNHVVMAPALTDITTLESLRSIANLQKLLPDARFGVLSSPMATALQNDNSLKSSLFYGILNGGQGYREFRNVCGVKLWTEYPDMPTNGSNIVGYLGDPRSLVFASRRITYSNAAEQLGVPEIMQFYQVTDPQTGLELTGVYWQQPGTGDVYLSVAGLFGVSAGNQGGAPGSITDNAGILITAS